MSAPSKVLTAIENSYGLRFDEERKKAFEYSLLLLIQETTCYQSLGKHGLLLRRVGIRIDFE